MMRTAALLLLLVATGGAAAAAATAATAADESGVAARRNALAAGRAALRAERVASEAARRAARLQRRARRQEERDAPDAAARVMARDTAAMVRSALAARSSHAAGAYAGGGGDCPAGSGPVEAFGREPIACLRVAEESQRLDAAEQPELAESLGFGVSLATGDNGLLAVGSLVDPDDNEDEDSDNGRAQEGRVQVYRRTEDGSYALLQVLTGADEEALRLLPDGTTERGVPTQGEDANVHGGLQFGRSVALTNNEGGTWLLVGMPGFAEVRLNRGSRDAFTHGAVALYRLEDEGGDNERFELTQVIEDPDTAGQGFDGDFDGNAFFPRQTDFGVSVALGGTVGLVGAPNYQVADESAGAVYVLQYDVGGNAWVIEADTPLTVAGLTGIFSDINNYELGGAVAFDAASGFAVLGAVETDVNVGNAKTPDDVLLDAGSAFIVRYDEALGAFELVNEVFAPVLEGDAQFGKYVAVAGSVVVVSSQPDDDFLGNVEVFEFDDASGTFVHRQTLEQPGVTTLDVEYDYTEEYSDGGTTDLVLFRNDFFGVALAVSADGRTIVVGADEFRDYPEGSGGEVEETLSLQGCAFVFTRASTADDFVATAQLRANDSARFDDEEELGASVAISADGGDIIVGAVFGEVETEDGDEIDEVGAALVFRLD